MTTRNMLSLTVAVLDQFLDNHKRDFPTLADEVGGHVLWLVERGFLSIATESVTPVNDGFSIKAPTNEAGIPFFRFTDKPLTRDVLTSLRDVPLGTLDPAGVGQQDGIRPGNLVDLDLWLFTLACQRAGTGVMQ
jgi:hypothetical protein